MKNCRIMIFLVALILALTGCDDDYNGGGGGSDGGDYGTYWGIVETISAEGYVPEMTQKPEGPAPRSGQEDCPTAMVLLMLLGGLYARHLTSGQMARSYVPIENGGDSNG